MRQFVRSKEFHQSTEHSMSLAKFRTYFSETHLISQDAILTLAPQVRQPVQSSELKILQFTPRFGDVFRVFSDLLERWALGTRVGYTFVWELGLRFPLTIRFKLLPRDRTNLFEGFPRAVFVIETIPLAEVINFTLCTVTMRNDTFNRLVKLEVFLLAFLVQKERFALLGGKAGGCKASLITFVRLDVVIHPLEPLVSLEELVCFVGVP
jgi:hypothetical protein